MSYRENKVGTEISEMDDAIRTMKKLNHLNISTTFSPDEKIARE